MQNQVLKSTRTIKVLHFCENCFILNQCTNFNTSLYTMVKQFLFIDYIVIIFKIKVF